MIFDALVNAAYRVPLHGPEAELEGGGCSNTPQPSAFGAEHRPRFGFCRKEAHFNLLHLIYNGEVARLT